MSAPILPGAEPWSAEGGPHGALVVHGFTGTPQSMRGLAHAFAAAGFAVEMPLLPGHGTTPEEMNQTTWADWSAAAEQALGRLTARCAGGRVVVAGLSMGGALTLWLAERHPEIAAIVCINSVAAPIEAMADLVTPLIEAGHDTMDAIGNDVADPEITELAYDKTPLHALVSMGEGLAEVQAALGKIACPTLVVTSRQDHVVPTDQSDLIAEGVSGPVERIFLERSYHVATLDYDKDLIEREAVAFAQRVTG